MCNLRTTASLLSLILNRKFRYLLCFSIYLIHVASAQVTPGDTVRRAIDLILQERGEAYIAVPTGSYTSALTLSPRLSLGKIRNDTAYFFITAKDTSHLYSTGIMYSLETAPSLASTVNMASSVTEVLQGMGYPTYSQYLSIMSSIRDSYPEIVTIDTIGQSVNNRLIMAARFRAGNLLSEHKPVVFLTSTIHGNEPPGYVILLMLLNELTTNYQSSSRIKELLDQVILIINPLANPDGTYFYSDTTVAGSIRNNLNNFDLNRNFPDPNKGWFPGGPRQPENIAMMNYLEKFRPNLSANLHSGAEVVNYPWDWAEIQSSNIEHPHPDNEWFRFISTEYADVARNGYPAYMNLFPGGITNGASWYVIYGGRQDYVTAFLRGRELTIELSNDFIPPAGQLNWLYERNHHSLLNLIQQSTYGVYGKIRDELTGEILAGVKIKLPDQDTELSYIYSDSITGTFRRYLKAGSYQIVFEKTGYTSQEVNVNISDYESVNLDIHLVPDHFIYYPNPFNYELYIQLSSGITGSARADVVTLTGEIVYSGNYNITKGLNILTVKPSINHGIYILRVVTEEGVWAGRIIKME